MRSLLIAVRLLTGLPLPGAPTITADNIVGSMLWFPIVGAGVGAVLGTAELLLRAVAGLPELSCGAAVALGLLITQARPALGLMVVLGALFSGRDAESLAQLAASNRPTSFGLLAGVVCLLFRYALLLAISPSQRFGALVMAWGLSRAAIVWVCWRFPYAGIDTGIGGWLAALAGPRDLILVLPVVALGFGLLPWLSALAVTGGAWVLSHGLALWVVRTLSGVTAHTCGAAAEAGELGALSALAAIGYLPIW